MQSLLILCLISALFGSCLVDANHSLPYDVYVRKGGLPLPYILRRNDSWYKPDRRPIITPRVFNGGDTLGGQFPSIVSLVISKTSGDYLCGGSIINSKTILTAAHCVIGVKSSDIEVRAGSLNIFEGSIVKVSEIKTHPSYNNETIDYDIALLITTNKIPIDNKNVSSVPLANHEPVPGVKVYIAGWGATHKGGLSNELQFASIVIVDRKKCQWLYAGQITERMICAGDNFKKSTTCKGDSGGPLIQNKIQVGVVSWGVPCVDDGYPGVYVNVANLLPWINSNKS